MLNGLFPAGVMYGSVCLLLSPPVCSAQTWEPSGFPLDSFTSMLTAATLPDALTIFS